MKRNLIVPQGYFSSIPCANVSMPRAPLDSDDWRISLRTETAPKNGVMSHAKGLHPRVRMVIDALREAAK